MTAIKNMMRTWHTPFINIDEMTKKKKTKTKESKRKRKMGSASIYPTQCPSVY